MILCCKLNKEHLMALKLNGYETGIVRLYAYRVYEGLLCGQVDTEYHNSCEEKAKDEFWKFSTMKDAHYYFAPERRKKPLSSFSKDHYIHEEYNELYDENNFPEEKLKKYWLFIELESYDEDLQKDTDGFCTGLSIACNIQDIDIHTIQEYLYENLTKDVWQKKSVDYTP